MDQTTTNPTAASYAAADAALSAVLDVIGPEQWDAPSRCEDWAVRDVVRHLIETQRSFLVDRGLDVGVTPGASLDDDPAAAWRTHAAMVTELIADDDVLAIEYDGYFGPMTLGGSLVAFYVVDMVVHRWDVAAGIGGPTRLTAAELDLIEAGMESWGDAIYVDGVCRPGLDAPAGSSRQVRVLAHLGRRDW